MLKRILTALKEGPNDKKKIPVPAVPSITLPKFEMTDFELSQRITDMKKPKFWLQQALKNEKTLHRYDYAAVFYRQFSASGFS